MRMQSGKIEHITVAGTGMIGSDVTLLCAMFHYPVVMLGRSEESIQRGLTRIRKNLAYLTTEGVYTREDAEHILGSIRTETAMAEAVREADFVLEGILEDIQLKHELFVELDRHCPPHTILASSTSGLSPNAIGEGITRKDKMLVAHFWNPPYLVPLVEVVTHDNASKETIDTVTAFLESLGKTPVHLKKDIAGHIGNRLQHALFREAIHLVEEGVAAPEDIDRVILSSLGPRYSMIGPMEYMDSVGLDLQVAVQSYLFETLADAKRPQKLLMENYERGDYGAKTGKGFYDWTTEKNLDEMVGRQNTRFITRLQALQAAKKSGIS
ncbi:3-hydroxybutyryl-CoA dehydrogenase [candidate division KSB3 bacterium]|uniref:L-gulonate 3-dehydrogenase n=1 Tax=candidate division KSB3 bacterium TaxID=2044937 RepID=A0A2G6E7M0_9BACT|nr:MAG: 3-hydroxybutyryl-CoA dehydrogenase [candidate division KSB3 bacterium]PIE30447.1 MAG: 3-hydroxybutyryl-CoA dehydrogenase [candidate division KSB3 bacterium]